MKSPCSISTMPRARRARACSTPVSYTHLDVYKRQAQGAYEAEVSVRSQSASERNTGFSRGLIQVLTKLTGERAPQQRPDVGAEVRNAKDYVCLLYTSRCV